jgi:hypothetical protein
MDNARNDWLENGAPDRLSAVDEACRNLHAEEEGPRTLTCEFEKMISALSIIPKLSSLLCSLENTVSVHQPARRGPSGAKRRAWRTKARYQRSRCPKRLRPWQIEGLFEADCFARSIELPLNTFVTVSWQNTRAGEADIQRRFQQATKAMGQWFRRRNCPATWIFVHENPGNSRPNCHLLIHVPDRHLASFKAIAPVWFDAMEGGVHIRKRNGPRDSCLSYMVKRAPTTLRLVAMERRLAIRDLWISREAVGRKTSVSEPVQGSRQYRDSINTFYLTKSIRHL